jgi:hypothetical protein
MARTVFGFGHKNGKRMSGRFLGDGTEKLSQRIEIKALTKNRMLEESETEQATQTVDAQTKRKGVAEMIPTSMDELYEMWSSKNKIKDIGGNSQEKFKSEFDKWASEPQNKFDFSEKTVSRIREIIESAVNESPRFSAAVEKFGMPIILAKTESAERASLAKLGDEDEEDKEVKVISDTFLTSINFMPSAINEIYGDSDVADKTALLSRSTNPSMGDAMIDQTINGQIRHEWSHHLLLDALANSERIAGIKSLSKKDIASLTRIAEKYVSDSTLMPMLDKEFSDTPKMPRTITRYAHANMFEMFAEGMNAYLHPDTTFERFVMNAVLRKDVQEALNISTTDGGE